MRSEMDEAKVTAYALGDLDNDERSAFEPLVAASEDTLREVGEIRVVAAALRDALAQGSRHELRPEQRLALDDAALRRRPTTSASGWHLSSPLRAAAMLAAAAALILTVVVPFHRLAAVAPTPAPKLMAPTTPAPELMAPTTLAATAFLPTPSPTLRRASPRSATAGASQEQREQLAALGYLGNDSGAFEPEGVRLASAPYDTEAYDHTSENPFVLVAQDPRSTFSVDVDTASYANVRRFLNGGALPPKDAVRIEELINYFPYAYAPPNDGRPFAVYVDAAGCPWTPRHRLVRIAIKGREVPRGERPPANLVFLLDVSGSMNEPNKLPLVKVAMRILVDQLGPADRVAIVVYAGAQGLALPSTPATAKTAILAAVESLSPGGMTHGSAGIGLAYDTATANFIKGGINRVILATDGDFNVGVTSQGALVRLIEEKAKTGVFLTTLGFGMGNLKDSTLEKLADHGNGNYAYIDGIGEARKVFVEQIGATLETIAKDVKLQIEFNPRQVRAFRLVGYENRVLAHRDFNDDKKDAGDIGAGHTVTAFYEVVPANGADVAGTGIDSLKYQQAPKAVAAPDSGELLTLKLRYKRPDADQSSLIEVVLKDGGASFQAAPREFRFAAAVAAFGMALRDSPHKGNLDLGKVAEWARSSLGEDNSGLRAEFLRLVEDARVLQPK